MNRLVIKVTLVVKVNLSAKASVVQTGVGQVAVAACCWLLSVSPPLPPTFTFVTLLYSSRSLGSCLKGTFLSEGVVIFMYHERFFFHEQNARNKILGDCAAFLPMQLKTVKLSNWIWSHVGFIKSYPTGLWERWRGPWCLTCWWHQCCTKKFKDLVAPVSLNILYLTKDYISLVIVCSRKQQYVAVLNNKMLLKIITVIVTRGQGGSEVSECCHWFCLSGYVREFAIYHSCLHVKSLHILSFMF